MTLRSYAFLDRMQPQFAAFVASNARGYLPVSGQASLYIEVEPGMALLALTDVAVKSTRVRPALQIVERAYGVLEVHDEDQAEVLEAGRQMLERIGRRITDRMRPRIVSSDILTRIDDHHAMLVNRMRRGSMLESQETLLTVEIHPAGYAALAANEAEKHAPVNLLHVEPYGAFGRVWLGGTEAAIRAAEEAMRRAIDAIEGVAETAELHL